jgi:hypothetical protein
VTADPVKAKVRMAVALSVRVPRRERIVVTWFGRTGHLDGADCGERAADRVARGGRPGLGGRGRAEDGRAARDADGGQRPGDPGRPG